VVLGLAALALTGCSAGDWERNLRFGWPTGATRQATEMRVLWTWAGVAALALGIVVWGLIFWCCIRYRKRSDDQIPRQTKYNAIVEGVCVFFPFVIIAALFYRTVVVEDNVNHLSKNPDVNIQVDAFKWNWQFEYHQYTDASGSHTLTYPGRKALADPTGNKLDNERKSTPPKVCDEASSVDSYNCGASGQRTSTTGGPLYVSTVGSELEIPVLVIPVNRSVRFVEHSYDVIHSFWVPEFLFKRDVIPYGTNSTARDNQFEITPTKTGSFVGRCAELCGTYHSQMNFEVRVVPEQTFVKYVDALKLLGPDDPARQRKALKIAMPSKSGYATTTYPLDTDRIERHQSNKSGS
jgi:cytochrome c oxidase subunit II